MHSRNSEGMGICDGCPAASDEGKTKLEIRMTKFETNPNSDARKGADTQPISLYDEFTVIGEESEADVSHAERAQIEVIKDER